MKADFSLSKFYGKYYELWYHDWTQNVLCPKPSCVNTNKTYEAATNQVVGNWHLECFGKDYPVELRFNVTDQRGVFRQHNKEGFNTNNIVVAAKESSTPGNDQYDWVIEFQCAVVLGHVDFVGINWYSKFQVVNETVDKEMLAVARARGLGPYMDSTTHGSLHAMSQTSCID